VYTIYLSKQVKKFIEKQDKNLKQRIKKAFKELERNPYPTNLKIDVKKLKASNNYRLRIGKFRFKYFIESDFLVVTIEEADSRGNIYKGS
jgi:mRNA interferase RelE/StbE